MSEVLSFCPFCGIRLANGASFCQSCGKQISATNSTLNLSALKQSSRLIGFWEWFKARSIKGKIFYTWWVISNSIGLVQIIALFAPDDTIQTGCGAKFTMRTFLDGTSEACGPTQSEQMSARFIALIIENVILASVLIFYKKYRSLPIKSIFSTLCALSVGLSFSLFNNAYISTKNEYPQDIGFSMAFGGIFLMIGILPLLVKRLGNNSN